MKRLREPANAEGRRGLLLADQLGPKHPARRWEKPSETRFAEQSKGAASEFRTFARVSVRGRTAGLDGWEHARAHAPDPAE